MKNKTPTSRREFLATLGGSAALLGLAGCGTGPGNVSLESLAGTDWDALRRQFGIRKGLAYMNNGTLGPCPEYVIRKTFEAWQKLEENPADEGFGPLLEEAETVRAKAAAFLGCSKDDVVITHNTTEAMNTVAQGLNLERGQHILTTNHEHPGGSVGWEYYARRAGIQIDKIQLPLPPREVDEILNLIEGKLNKSTRVISVSHVTFTTGLRMPIREIAKLAEANGSLLVVDGAQAPGALNVNVKDLGCHTYATSAHKWMLAPKGTGILYIGAAARKQIEPLLLQHGNGTYTASTGTRNVPALIGLGAAIDFLTAIGKVKIERRAMDLRNKLYEGLAKIPRFKTVSPPPGPMAAALVTGVLPEGIEGAKVGPALREKHGVIVKVLPKDLLNGLRISSHIYNSEEDVDRLVVAMRKELGS